MVKLEIATKLNQILPDATKKKNDFQTEETVKSEVELLEGGSGNEEFVDAKIKSNQVQPANNHFDTLPKSSIRRIKTPKVNVKNLVLRFIDY